MFDLSPLLRTFAIAIGVAAGMTIGVVITGVSALFVGSGWWMLAAIVSCGLVGFLLGALR